MPPKELAEIARSEFEFRIFMVDHAARMDEICTQLKENCAEQFRRLREVESLQATATEKTLNLEKRLDATSGRSSMFGAAAGTVGGFLGGLIQGLIGRQMPGGGA